MIIKICGIKHAGNLKEISTLNVDMVGFNFYSASPRYLDHPLPIANKNISRVGVFVKADKDYILEQKEQHQLDFAQLHGDESADFAKEIQKHIPVIKVFRIGPSFDTKILRQFDFCDHLLFDTSTSHFGGSGLKFNWEILNDVEIDTPFLLSGGIGPEDVDSIRNIEHEYFRGIDINSKFELEPGIKDANVIKNFIKEINEYE